MKFVKAEKSWCEHCDSEVGDNLIEVWGTISSGELSTWKFDRAMYGQYVAIRFYLCDKCKKEMFQ